jgi:RNA polymerase sigma-70 factor (ECF subfamily)
MTHKNCHNLPSVGVSICERGSPVAMSFTRRKVKTAAEAKPAETGQEFDDLFQQHWTRLCGVLYRLVGDWAEAEDLALDVFVRLYRRPPPKQENLGGWLYRVATRLGFNALRARKRRQRYEEEAGYQVQGSDPTWDPALVIEQTQERERVRRTLGRMKPRSAQLLILRSAGLSYVEVAAALEISPGSVGTLLARAEREFEKAYQET